MVRTCGGAYQEASACKPEPSSSTLSLESVSSKQVMTTRAGSDGGYSLTVPAGTYTVRIDGAVPGNYGTRSVSGPKQVSVPSGRRISVDFTITINLL
jgi:hypothetical protein